MKKLLTMLLCVCLVAAALGACSPAAQQPAAPSAQPSGGEASAAPSSAPQSSAPAEGDDMLLIKVMEGSSDRLAVPWFNIGQIYSQCLFSRTLSLDTDTNPLIDQDSLAESYTVSDDYLHYEFVIRDGVTWHDGQPLSAEDIAYSIQFALRFPSLSNVLRTSFRAISGGAAYADGQSEEIPGLKVEGNKLILDMDIPDAFVLLSIGQFNIFPKHHLENLDPVTFATNEFWAHPIGSGPYSIEQFAPNDYVILKAYDGYFGNKAEIPYARMGFYEEGDYVVLAQSGQIDYVHTMDNDTAKEIEKLENYTVQSVPIMFARMLFWNSYGPGGNGNDPIADLNVRKALIHAIDRQAVVDSLFDGNAVVHNSRIPATYDYYNNDVYDYRYDPELAKSMLEDAGFDFGTTLRLATYYGNQQTANVMDAIVYYFDQVGVKAEWFVLTGDLTAQIYDVRDYNLLYGDNSAMSPIEIYQNYSSSVGGYISKLFPTTPNAMDPLIEQYKVTADLDAQKEILKQMQAVEADLGYYLPLFTINEFIITNNRIQGEIIYGNEWNNYDRGICDWTLG